MKLAKSIYFEKNYTIFCFFAGVKYGSAQPSSDNFSDTARLIAQKENIITPGTIIKLRILAQK